MNARPPSANIRVPSIPPWRTSATSVVPPPTSTNSAPAWRTWSLPEDPGDRVRLGDDLEQLEVELRGDALERPEVDERRERVEDPDLDVAALEADRVGQRVAVDRRADDRGVDEPDVDVRQARSPR